MKNVLIVVGMLVIFNAVLVFSGALDKLIETKDETVTPPTTIAPDVVSVFRFTLEDEVNKKLGQPIEGYEPSMFIAAFPGLVESDFDGVEASIGHYQINNGKLEHVFDEKQLIHSAAGAIGREGMTTLLKNISARTGINLNTTGTITDVINVITNPRE